MSRPYEGKGKRCDHPGCKVWISLAEQPRRFALGLCRTHEAKPGEAPARKRVSDRPDVRQALVLCAPNNSSGVLAKATVSLAREPWETPVDKGVDGKNALQLGTKKDELSGPEECFLHPTGPKRQRTVGGSVNAT